MTLVSRVSVVISVIQFCDFISVSWLVHLAGRAVWILLDYVGLVPLCSKLKQILAMQKEWPEICNILGEKYNDISCLLALFIICFNFNLFLGSPMTNREPPFFITPVPTNHQEADYPKETG